MHSVHAASSAIAPTIAGGTPLVRGAVFGGDLQKASVQTMLME
jgi:hypothetical protein